METKKALELIFVAAGKKKQDIAKFLHIAIPSFTIWLNKLNQVERLIKICNFCGCDVVITDHQNININLSISSQEKTENK